MINLIVLFFNLMKLNNCQKYESIFRIRALTTTNQNYGLALNSSIKNSNKDSCLRNDDCAFVLFKNGACGLYNENAKRFLVPSNERMIYEVCSLKISDYICVTNHVYSFKQNKCVPCPINFFSDNRYPFKCYVATNKYLNYSRTVAECAKYDLTIMRPKSLNERQIILNRFVGYLWVDSRITKVGATFLWPDGAKVYGFGINEPDNLGHFNDLVEKNVAITADYLVDVFESSSIVSLCELTDSNEYLYY
ncbi:unnamed protein product [Brachionus calyciflorus]|uniref:C-type lectin domain-containing protein n=1 Tax=Brachionus calyciflorus TaxID=104777 RepID=A0A814R3R3_9BILA|nr:unnamed protein product [Brachionus calyciflorus]